MKRAALIVGHGSKMRGFEAAMVKTAREIKREGRFDFVDLAYLEITRPSISEAIDRLVKKGAAEIRVLPYFVLSGRHVASDIPAIIARARERCRGSTRIVLCPYLGYHPKIVSVVKERLRQKDPGRRP